MRKVCSFFYVLWILLLLSTSMVVFIPYAFLRLMQFQRAADAYLNTLAHGYGRLVFFSARVKLEVRGLENLPKEDRALVFVANHQSITDVVVLKTVIPYPMGFMAKIELFRVPFIQVWLAGLRCIAIDRSNLRKSMEAIRKGSSQVASGYPMVIFPEGTRSRCNGMRAFKGGSLKLAEWAKGRIVPITLDGTDSHFSPADRYLPDGPRRNEGAAETAVGDRQLRTGGTECGGDAAQRTEKGKISRKVTRGFP